jgi:hypothetical protein
MWGDRSGDVLYEGIFRSSSDSGFRDDVANAIHEAQHAEADRIEIVIDLD